MRVEIKRRWLMAGIVFGSVLIGISLKMTILARLDFLSGFQAASNKGLEPAVVAGSGGEVLVVVLIGGFLMFGLALLVPSFILRRRLNRATTSPPSP